MLEKILFVSLAVAYVSAAGVGLRLGERCHSKTGPCIVANSDCITYRCKCVKPWVKDGDTCVRQDTRQLGATCRHLGLPCKADGSECRAYRCFCRDGFTKNELECQARKLKEAEEREESLEEQLIKEKKLEELLEEAETLEEQEEKVLANDGVRLGRRCNSNTGPCADPNSDCITYRCKCVTGWVNNKDGDACVLCPADFLPWRGRCYYFSYDMNVRMSRSDAITNCESRSAKLLSIETEEENDFIKKQMEKRGMLDSWTSLSRHDGVWGWGDTHTGSGVIYTDWKGQSHPSPDPNMMCMLINKKGRYAWISSLCKWQKPFICEM